MYYHESTIRIIMAANGQPVKLHTLMRTSEREHFTRICVEINLSMPVMKHVWISDHWQVVEYESLHLICPKCDHYWHATAVCMFCKED